MNSSNVLNSETNSLPLTRRKFLGSMLALGSLPLFTGCGGGDSQIGNGSSLGGGRGVLVYSQTEASTNYLDYYWMSPQTPTQQNRFVTNAYSFSTTALHPNGQTLAYQHKDDQYNSNAPIYLMLTDLNGTNTRRLTTYSTNSPAGLDWFPDGSKLLFASETGSLDTIKMDGTDRQVLIEKGDSPAISPDGTKIAYFKNFVIYLYDVATKTETVLPLASNSTFGLRWHPDGKRLLYYDYSSDLTSQTIGYYLQTLGGTPSRRYLGSFQDALVSPDGSLYVYVDAPPAVILPNGGGVSGAKPAFAERSSVRQVHTLKAGDPPQLVYVNLETGAEVKRITPGFSPALAAWR